MVNVEQENDVPIPENFKVAYVEMSDGAKLRHLYFPTARTA